ncbi:MAG TPA: hypothetical protein VK811_02955 [Candidatus Acidoferrum sp.]|jgi:hypothetical protein|nr:hypothetical protein [Candidatus Acidoferrum sp.]
MLLARRAKAFTLIAMNFALAILAYLVIGAIFGAAILLLVAGKPLLFIITLVVFVLAFAKLGCLTQH